MKKLKKFMFDLTNLLIIVAHPEDETVFAGGLLTNIAHHANIKIICMSPANEAFVKVCEEVGAEPILTNFKDSDWEFDYLQNFLKTRQSQIEEMRTYLQSQIKLINPNTIITHNSQGEYDHTYHKIINRICKSLHFNNVYVFGHEMPNCNCVKISYNKDKKKALLDYYPGLAEKFFFVYDVEKFYASFKVHF